MQRSCEISAPLGIKIHFRDGLNINFPAGHRAYQLRVLALHNNETVFNGTIASRPDRPVSFKSRQKYYIPWLIEIRLAGALVFQYRLSLAGEPVVVDLTPGTLGDMVAWMPATLNFARKHNFRLTVLMRRPYIEMFASAYPEVVFLHPRQLGVEDAEKYYAVYPVAVEGNGFTDYSPADYQKVNLQDYAAITLGVEFDHNPPLLAPATEDCRVKYGRYVCIASRASRKMKQWNRPGGWEAVTDFLLAHGYRVFDIDADNQAMPANAEDFTGELPLRQRIDLLRGCEFMIGLASGLSWVGWACGRPTVLISGFSETFTEFFTPYRIIDRSGCYGCFNYGDMRFNEFDKCVSKRDYECTRVITPERVLAEIKRIPNFGAVVDKSDY